MALPREIKAVILMLPEIVFTVSDPMQWDYVIPVCLNFEYI